MQIWEFSENITVPSNFGPCGNRKLGCGSFVFFEYPSLHEPSSFSRQNKTAPPSASPSIDVTVAARGESPLFFLPKLC